MKKCPFTGKECIGQDCTGWIDGECFIKQLNLKANGNATTPPEPLHIVLGVDFGTAYTKIQARQWKEKEEVLHILRTEKGAFRTPSEAYIKDGLIFFGDKARRKFLEDSLRRKVCRYVTSLKSVILECAQQENKKSVEKVTKRLESSLGANPHFIITSIVAFAIKRAMKTLGNEVSLQAVNYGWPSLEDFYILKPYNPARFIHATRYIELAVTKAVSIAEHMHDEMCLDELFYHYFKAKEDSAAQIRWNYEPASVLAELCSAYREYDDGIYGLVDIGAGTTDVGFMHKEGNNSKICFHASILFGENEVDKILFNYICKRTNRDEIRSFLKNRIRDIKENFIRNEHYEVNFSKYGFSGAGKVELSLSELEPDLKMYRERMLYGIKELMENADEKICKNHIPKGRFREKPEYKYIFVSGGGSFLLEKHKIVEQACTAFGVPVKYLHSEKDVFPELSDEDFRLQMVAIGLAHPDLQRAFVQPITESELEEIIKGMPTYVDKDVT